MGNKNVQLTANDLKIQHHGILSTFNDTIKSQYTDGFKANRFVISNSRKEPDANGTNGWGTGAIDRNTFLNIFLDSVCTASLIGTFPFIKSMYLFPFPSFFGAFAALPIKLLFF